MAKVLVYTADWCPWCHKLMDFLKQNNVEFEMRDVGLGDNAKEALEKSKQSGIPVTDIDGIIVVGFDVPRLKELLKLE